MTIPGVHPRRPAHLAAESLLTQSPDEVAHFPGKTGPGDWANRCRPAGPGRPEGAGPAAGFGRRTPSSRCASPGFPNPAPPLLDLCEGVYIARREKRLLQETELTEIIFRLFRSSETLLQLTGTELKRHGE